MSKKTNKSTVTVETPDTLVSYVEKNEFSLAQLEDMNGGDFEDGSDVEKFVAKLNAENVEAPKAESKLTKAGRPRLNVDLADKVLLALQNNVNRADIASNFNVHPSTVSAIAAAMNGSDNYIRSMYRTARREFPIPATKSPYVRPSVKGTRSTKKHSEAYNAVQAEAKARLDAAIATARAEYEKSIEQANKLDEAQAQADKAQQAQAQADKAQAESMKLQARIAAETAKMEKMQARIAEFTRAFTASK